MNYDASDLTIARGICFIDPQDATGALTGMVDTGEATFSFSTESEKAPFYSSRQGLQEKVADPVVKITRSGKLETANISIAMLALWLGSEVETVEQASGPHTETITAIAGRYYKIGATDANPAGLNNVTALTITDGAEVDPVTRALNAAYEVDLAKGLIKALVSGTFAITCTKTATSIKRIKSGAAASFKARVYIMGNNAIGSKRDYVLTEVALSPEGELPVIAEGQDYVKMAFAAEILTPENGNAVIVDGVPVVVV